ncbi:protein kinase domain-containing protein [Mucisphaera calidilacus]|uniref:Serine/threonine-protein kinase StkP n=1 Tax=Mucisphaera calidilacus TaxID=2527982 RepID=A0A518BWB2_9BACT|nr:protein kinase [Mucisphaera calidilacus]QDU71260.1 Serine/threonine-protein kinase StkP [Mucisphaera calidilacus]
MNTTSPQKGYRHQAGDRPLDGYTIKRAAGRGGFGEVYFAVSDSGREVALKAVQGFEDIELRGIAHCMNLKSPHLVSIFDVRRNENGEPFVIMEYVGGPSLRRLIDESPSGLGEQKTAFFLREIAKGLSYLHDCGIVHRDLKPANIFYDEGYVKIGDYGLSKAMSASPQQSQTITVGTVHYMAPEIGGGRYDRSIDIYALGVLVYELLTGQVPFFGGSPAEVLMKHLSTNVDTTQLPAPFDRVVAKAMAKDPADRYASVREMVEDVFGAQHIRESVADFGAEDLTVYARRAADKINAAPLIDNLPDSANPETWQPAKDQPDPRRFNQTDQQPPSPQPRPILADPTRDNLSHGQRLFLCVMTLLTVAAGSLYISAIGEGWFNLPELMGIGLIIAGVAATHVMGLFIARSWFGQRLDDAPVLQRIAYATTAALTSALFVLPILLIAGDADDPGVSAIAMLWLTCLIPVLTLDVHRSLELARPSRVSIIRAALAALVVGLPMAVLTSGSAATMIFAAMAAAISLAAQIMAAYDPVASRNTHPLTAAERAARDEQEKMTPELRLQAQKRSEEIRKRAREESARETAEQAKADAEIDPSTSPRMRTIALILVATPMMGIPIFGLHRFYAGKIVTGIIWLLTGGLFGIGQFLDALFIITGHFEDDQERPIRTWWDESRQQQHEHRPRPKQVHRRQTPASSSSYSDYVGGAIAGTLAIFAYIALFGAAAITGITIFGGPYFLTADVPGLGLDQLAVELFGEGDWQPGFLQALQPIAIVLLCLGTALMVLARRRAGIGHMFRSLLGIGILSAAAVVGYGLFDAAGGIEAVWNAAAEQVQHGAIPTAFISVMQAMNVELLFVVQILVLLGVLLLAWPARRRNTTTETQP